MPRTDSLRIPMYPMSDSLHSLYTSSQPSLMSYDKKCVWSGYCKAFVIIVIVILVAWGVAVPLYFTGE